MTDITITLTLPRALSLHRLCQALRAIGLKMSYSGDNSYQLTEIPE